MRGRDKNLSELRGGRRRKEHRPHVLPAEHSDDRSRVVPRRHNCGAHAVRRREARRVDEGGEVPAWLACAPRAEIGAAPGFYLPDKSVVGWVAD